MVDPAVRDDKFAFGFVGLEIAAVQPGARVTPPFLTTARAARPR
jgi:hypothetical protein